MPGRLKRDKMVEKHKEENEELKTEREDREKRDESRDTGENRRRDRRRKERDRQKKEKTALLLFKTMTGNVAKDSHIVQQDTVQYIGFITNTVCNQMNRKCGQEWVEGSYRGSYRVIIGHIK